MRRKLKIAYDCRHLQKPELDDGASRYSFELLNALSAADESLELYCAGYRDTLPGTELGRLVDRGLRFIPAFDKRSSTGTNYLLAQFVLPGLLRKYGIDMFHALFQTEVLALSAVPQIVTVHDPGPYYSYGGEVRGRIEAAAGISVKNRLQDRLRFRFIKKAEVVLADSGFTKKRLVELGFARAERVEVVYPGLAQCAAPAGGAQEVLARYEIAGPYVLMVGRIQPYKNILGAIKAFNILKSRFSYDGVLVVAGSAKSADEKKYLAECRKLAGLLGLGAYVKFTGYVPDPNLRVLYGNASVFLQASFLEGFGFPPLEAAGCGAPVVVSDMGSLPEVLPHAVKVAPFDPVNIAAGLAAALRSGKRANIKWNDWGQTAIRVSGIYRVVGEKGK